MEFRRYSINDVNQTRFYQMPKFLFEGELKTKISAEAKVLYALLRDRHELSLSNNWIDKDGYVYLIFTRDEMCELLGFGKDKILKLKTELKKFNLCDEVRQGLNKPNLIYLNYIDFQNESLEMAKNKEVGNTDIRKSEIQTSGSLEFRPQEVYISDSNDTDISDTDVNDTNHSFYQDKNDGNEYSQTVKENLMYDEITENPEAWDVDIGFLDTCYELICEVVNSKSKKLHIGKEEKPISVLRSRFLKIQIEHIQYVQSCLQKNTTQIKNIKAYLLSTLYNSTLTMDLHIEQQVQHDMNRYYK